MKRRFVTILAAASLILLGAAAQAKIPEPQATPEQQAKAEAAKAKAAEAAKKEADLLGKAQDRAADNYKKGKGKTAAASSAK